MLIPPDKGSRSSPRRGWVGGRYGWMRTVLGEDLGRGLYRKRKQTVEPLFGNTNTTKVPTDSTDEAGSRYAPSGGY